MAAFQFLSILACLFLTLMLSSSLSSAARMTSPGLHRRQAPFPPAASSPTINTTIHDKEGVDITSSFKTMIFKQQLANVSLPANLTNKRRRSLSSRMEVDPDIDYSEPRTMFRTIISCQQEVGLNWRFVRSECDHSRSMQTYTIWCRQYVREHSSPRTWGHYGPTEPKQATCTAEETCINGPERTREGQVAVAWCIKREAFIELALDATGRKGGGVGGALPMGAAPDGAGSGQQQQGGVEAKGEGSGAGGGGGAGKGSGVTVFAAQQQKAWAATGAGADTSNGDDSAAAPPALKDLELGGVTLSAVASKPDGVTPLSLQTFDVEAGILGGEDGNMLVGVDGGTALQEEKCENCVDLQMSKFAKGTEALRTEATVLTAVSGVVWLALFAV